MILLDTNVSSEQFRTMPDETVIALDSGFSVATRDVSPFLAAGVKVINPGEDQE